MLYQNLCFSLGLIPKAEESSIGRFELKFENLRQIRVDGQMQVKANKTDSDND